LAAGIRGSSLIVMESRSNLAAELPLLYRAALDAIDQLRQLGRRQDATRLRDEAIRAYSRAWDDRCRRALEDVARRASDAGAAEAIRAGQPLSGAGLAG
jgi:hypothetical protein